MPKDFKHMELRPKPNGFCFLCGTRWTPKPDPKDRLPAHKRFGLWEVCGHQALHKGQRKKSVKICNDCLTLIRLASKDITTFHLQWLQVEMEESQGSPRMSPIGQSVLVAVDDEMPEPVAERKVAHEV